MPSSMYFSRLLCADCILVMVILRSLRRCCFRCLSLENQQSHSQQSYHTHNEYTTNRSTYLPELGTDLVTALTGL